MTNPASYLAYVGTRTTQERHARGDGLNVYRVDSATGQWTHLQLVGDLVNPSYLAFDRRSCFLYVAHGDRTEISAFAIEKAGRLSFLNRQSTEGENPVHLAVDPTNRFVVVANHVTSTLALLPRHDDGRLGAVVDLVKLEGKIGPHRVEQPFAKPHQVEFDPSGRFIVVPDKGLDRTFTYRIDPDAAKLVLAAPPAEAREGAGPRHVAFHPTANWAYVINELDSTIAAYHFDRDTGALQPFQLLSALPDSFTGNSRASEIATSADGRRLFASNRGHDSITVFAIDGESGRLCTQGWQSSLGKTPRFFALAPDQRSLFVANEDSDTIVTLRLADDGGLAPTGSSLAVGSPVNIVFRVE